MCCVQRLMFEVQPVRSVKGISEGVVTELRVVLVDVSITSALAYPKEYVRVIIEHVLHFQSAKCPSHIILHTTFGNGALGPFASAVILGSLILERLAKCRRHRGATVIVGRVNYIKMSKMTSTCGGPNMAAIRQCGS